VFSPMVMSVYLFLLSCQLIFIFFKGMFPLADDGTIMIPESIFSLVIVVFVSILKIRGTGLISNFSILIGIVVGWLFYELLFLEDVEQVVQSAGVAFKWFPLGKPNLEVGIVFVSFFAMILNLSNTVTSISTVGNFYKNIEVSKKQFSQSIIVTSISSGLGSCFGLVPYTPFTSSIGFLQSTQIFSRKPFFIGGGLISLIGVIPVFSTFLATMPISVGNAVLFVAYLQLFGTAYNSLNGKLFNSNTVFRLAVPVLIGLSLMNMPANVFTSLPAMVQPFISNGLIIGVLLSIVLERTVNWSIFEKFEDSSLNSKE
jgi:xanthine/uracil permease